MDGNTTDRLSQKDYCRKEKIGSILEDAAEVAGGVLSSIQALAGTTACKGVQIARLKEWAVNNSLWIDDISQLGTYSDRGSENEVYVNNETQTVYKLNDFRYSDDNLMPFFERIRIHNTLFEDCPYEINVLMGIDGHLYFIDTIIYKSDTGGFDTYRTLSPNYSPKIR